MDQEIVTAVFGVLAALMTFITTYLKKKQSEAYVQGDIIISKFGEAAKAVTALATVIPKARPLAEDMEAAHKALEDAWNDPKVSTDDMMMIVGSMSDLIIRAKALIEAKDRPRE